MYGKIEYNGFLDFDDQELIHLIDKRLVYLESISKLYNELTMINKIKVKEREGFLVELEAAENNKSDNESTPKYHGGFRK